MRRLGIYIAVQPKEGGAYQYTLAVLDALAALDPQKFDVTCFFVHPAWRELLPAKFQQVYRPRGAVRRALNRIYSLFTGNRWLTWHFPSFFHPILNVMNRSDADLILYPAQDPFAYQCTKPALTTIHDLMHRYESKYNEYGGAEHGLRERHYAATCASAAGILVDSELGKQHVIESYGADGNKVHVLPYIAPTYFQNAKTVDVRKKYSLPERFFFYPAQFWEHKNHQNLLLGLASLRTRGIDARMVLVGSAKNNFSQVMTSIKTLGLSSAVHVLGFVSNDEMVSLYREATALVFVSMIGPTNIPPLEAMASGCPAIVSNIYAMPEQVGDAALLVDPHSPESIASAMERVWTDEAFCADLRAKGLRRALDQGKGQFNQKLAEIIRHLVK